MLEFCLKFLALIKQQGKVEWCCTQTYNQAHNILTFFDGWAVFPFTTSETNHDYYY